MLNRNWDCGYLYQDISVFNNEEPIEFDNYAKAIDFFNDTKKELKKQARKEFSIYLERIELDEDGEVEDFQAIEGCSFYHGAELSNLEEKMPESLFDEKVTAYDTSNL